MGKGRVASHYIVERIFFDPKRGWGKEDLKDRYYTGKGFGVEAWGHLFSARVYDGEEIDQLALPLCEGCDVVIKNVRLVLPQ